MNASIADSSILETNLSVDDFGTYQVAFTVDFCFGTDTMDVNFITVDLSYIIQEFRFVIGMLSLKEQSFTNGWFLGTT